jgi:DNA-binding PadR family transcriptional regulator
MWRVNTLGFAILGLLARRPLSGYRVAQLMREPIGFFWNAGHAQIHGTLRKLVEAGWAEYRTEPGPGPHDKKLYSATAAGRAALAEWATSPLPTPQPHDELLLRVYNGWLADPAAMREMLTAELERREASLAHYLTVRAEFEADGTPEDPTTQRFVDYATVLNGIGSERYVLDWLRWLIGTLRD